MDAPTLEGHARRPRWEGHPIDGAGHLLPVEIPDAYAAVVADWLPRIGRPGHLNGAARPVAVMGYRPERAMVSRTRLLGQNEAALREMREGVRLYERKGNIVGARRTRAV